MAKKLVAPLAPGLILAGGYVVRVTALDPTTGATVSGVTVSNVSMQVRTSEGDIEVIKVPEVAPLFVYGESG